MATRRRAVTGSIIITRSSSSSKTKNKPERYEHQTTNQASSNITTFSTTTTNQLQLPGSPSPVEDENYPCKTVDEEMASGSNWSTPKAKRFRIPEIKSCPPAPKKQRSSTCSFTNGVDNNCSSLRRSSICFFTPPELNEFFFRVSVVPDKSTTSLS